MSDEKVQISSLLGIDQIQALYSRNVLERIDQAVSEIIGRIDAPCVVCSMMRFLQCSISDQIPHLRVTILQVLLHTQSCFARSIASILHLFECVQRFLDRSIAMFASFTRSMVWPSSICMNLFGCTSGGISLLSNAPIIFCNMTETCLCNATCSLCPA